MGERDLYRRTVDAVIYGIVGDRIVAIRIGLLAQRCVRQVECLGAGTRTEERGIALGCCLYHLVLHRIQIHGILTRLRIRLDGDTLLLKQRMGHVVAAVGDDLAVADCLLHGVARQVVRVVHEMRRIVALELQHQLQVIAQVVGTNTESALQVALVYATGYTTDQSYLGLVVEAYAVQRLVERECLLAILYAQDTLALEGMSGLEDLQGIRLTLGHC